MTFTMPSRDSVIWTWGLIASVIMGLAGADGLNLLPAAWHHPVTLAAFIIGLISAYLKTSPLSKT